MSTRGKITHLRYTDPLAARATVHVALRDHGSIVGAARALHCSATWLRGYLAAEPAAAEGLTLRRRGWPLGKRRGTPRPAVAEVRAEHSTSALGTCDTCGACARPWRECTCGDVNPCPLDVAAGCT